MLCIYLKQKQKSVFYLLHLFLFYLQTKNVTNTSMKLEQQLLLPGHRYEAKVRTQASVGQWSDWSPVVTWQTEYGSLKKIKLDCNILNCTITNLWTKQYVCKLASPLTLTKNI